MRRLVWLFMHIFISVLFPKLFEMVHKIDKIIKKSGQRENEGRRNSVREMSVVLCGHWSTVEQGTVNHYHYSN